MKKTICLIYLTVIANFSFSQDPKQVTAEFKNIIAKIDSSFAKIQPFLMQADFSKSQSGKIFYLLKPVKIESAYDIEKTNSIISPYTGYIKITLQVLTNKGSGNVISTGMACGFDSEEQARKSESLTSCTDPNYNANEWCVGSIKINYAYQDDKWVLKNLDTEPSDKIPDGITRGDIEEILPSILK